MTVGSVGKCRVSVDDVCYILYLFIYTLVNAMIWRKNYTPHVQLTNYT